MSSPISLLRLHWAPSSSLTLVFFLTFSNTERFESRKIVSELSVQCNFVLFVVNVQGHPLQLPIILKEASPIYNLKGLIWWVPECWSETVPQMRLRGPSEAIKKKKKSKCLWVWSEVFNFHKWCARWMLRALLSNALRLWHHINLDILAWCAQAECLLVRRLQQTSMSDIHFRDQTTP